MQLEGKQVSTSRNEMLLGFLARLVGPLFGFLALFDVSPDVADQQRLGRCNQRSVTRR
jgi:hypothetical protein